MISEISTSRCALPPLSNTESPPATSVDRNALPPPGSKAGATRQTADASPFAAQVHRRPPPPPPHPPLLPALQSGQAAHKLARIPHSLFRFAQQRPPCQRRAIPALGIVRDADVLGLVKAKLDRRG